jgi:zinc transport system substrate-binding protein
VLLVAGIAACSSPDDLGSDGKPVVAVAFYPLEDIVQAVGGDAVHIVTVVPPGEEAHEYEPTPKQLTSLEQADVVFYLGGGFQPSVEKAIEGLPGSVTKIDLLRTLTMLPLAEGNDPHVWLDPSNMQAMAADVEAVLVAELPAQQSALAGRAQAYDTTLAALDQAFTDGLAHCTSSDLVTGHQAFGYLAAAYGLTQVAIAGISPGDEPSAQTLEDVASYVQQHGVTTIFFEENLPNDLSRTIADETGAGTGVLNTVESLSRDELSAGATYASAMRDNLTALQAGLGCS